MTPKRKPLKRGRPVTYVKPFSYQPSKAELEADARIPTTPVQLARVILQNVTIKPEK